MAFACESRQAWKGKISLRTADISPRSLPLRDTTKRNITQRWWVRRNVCHSQAKWKQPISFGWVWMSPLWEKFQFWQPGVLHFSAVFGLFLGVKETIVASPLFVVWKLLFCVFEIFCITSFGDCTHPQHQETTRFWATRQRNNINSIM